MNGSVPGGMIAFSRSAAPPVSAHGRLAGGQVDHPHVAPEHAPPHAGAQRLGAGLLGGEALGVGGGAVGPPVGLALLDLGEAPGDEALAEALERLLDPRGCRRGRSRCR